MELKILKIIRLTGLGLRFQTIYTFACKVFGLACQAFGPSMLWVLELKIGELRRCGLLIMV